MDFELIDLLDDKNKKSAEEKKNMANKMIDTFNEEELAKVINFQKKIFFNHKLRDYSLDSKLPDMKSREFLFLVQAAKYNGNIVRKLMNKAGITNYYLNKFIKKYNLKEISTGIFIFPKKNLDAAFLFQSQYSKAVISHESALYMLNLSDVIPRKTIMSMPKDYKLSQLKRSSNHYIKIDDGTYNNKKSLVVSYIENDPIILTKASSIDSSQIIMKETNHHNLVRITSEERTIADVLAPNSNTEEEIKDEALKRYYKLHPDNGNRLRRTAYQQGVLKELDEYLRKLQLN